MSRINSVNSYRLNTEVISKQNFTSNPNEKQLNSSNEQKHLLEKEKENTGFTFKKLTNILGVAAWIAIVTYSLKDLKLLQRKSPESIERGMKNSSKLLKNYKENLSGGDADIDKVLEGKSLKGLRKALYRIGDAFQSARMKTGDELFNNLLYALGTLVVMPLVVMFSPFGKKDSSKEDKAFAVLRQPLSVAATLGLQFTFDKMIDKYIPKVFEGNELEDSSILDPQRKTINLTDKKGKVIESNYNAIKYNSGVAKDGFKKLAQESGILNEEELIAMFENKSFESDKSETYIGKFIGILKKKFGINIEKLDDLSKNEAFLKLKGKDAQSAVKLEQLVTHFKKFASVLDFKEMTIQRSKTKINVIAASIIGCTFLNVIYGKSMKLIKGKFFKDKNEDKDAKEVK